MLNESAYILKFINLTQLINTKLLSIENKLKAYTFEKDNKEVFKTLDRYNELINTIRNINNFIMLAKTTLAKLVGDEEWDDITTIDKLSEFANKIEAKKIIILYDDRIGIFNQQFTNWKMLCCNNTTIIQLDTIKKIFNADDNTFISFINKSKTGMYITYQKLYNVGPGYLFTVPIRLLTPIFNDDNITINGYTDNGYTYIKNDYGYKINVNIENFNLGAISYIPICNLMDSNIMDISNLYNGTEDNRMVLKNFAVYWNEGENEEEVIFSNAEDFIKHVITEVYIQQIFLYTNARLYNFSRFITDYVHPDDSLLNMFIMPQLCNSMKPIEDYFIKDLKFSSTVYRENPNKRLIIFNYIVSIDFADNFSFLIDVFEMYIFYVIFINIQFDTVLTLTKNDDLQLFYTMYPTFGEFTAVSCMFNNFFKLSLENLLLTNLVNVYYDCEDVITNNYITLSENNKTVNIENIDFNGEKTFNLLGVNNLINGNGSMTKTLTINNCIFYKNYTNIKHIFSNFDNVNNVIISNCHFVGNIKFIDYVIDNFAVNEYDFINTKFQNVDFSDMFLYTENDTTIISNLKTTSLKDIYGNNTIPTILRLENCYIKNLDINRLIGNGNIKTIYFPGTKYNRYNFDGFRVDYDNKVMYKIDQ